MNRSATITTHPDKSAVTILHYGSILAVIVVFLVFSPALKNQFVALDDYAYIFNNSHIEKLGRDTLLWSLTSFWEGNWHPLTMLSLALDRQVWGLDPFGYHLSNLLIHSMTVYFTCHCYSMVLTAVYGESCVPGKIPASIFIGSIVGALVFGLHPLRVESVVWISERKDVLCLFFLTASLWRYLRYARQAMAGALLPFWRYGNYWAALLLAALAMMSKPAAVSIPFILCIIDWYPLRRWSGRSAFVRTVIEKTPFMVLSVVLAVLTLFAQQEAMKFAENIGLLSRLLVACKALFFYLGKTFWPTELAAYYVHPGNVAATAPSEYLLFALLTAGLIVAALAVSRRSRFWPALLCYYVVTLAPMLGLVQVGSQWAADRYSYLPALGLSLLWGCATVWLLERIKSKKGSAFACLGLAVIAAQLLLFTVLTLRQIQVWRTTETLASRIIELQPGASGGAYFARAVYRNKEGQFQLALADCIEAMKIALRQNNREMLPKIAFEEGVILKNLQRFSEALAIVEWGVQVSAVPPPADALALRDELKRLVR